MASTSGVLVDDNVLEVLRKAQCDQYVNKFVFQFSVRRFDHFSHVRDKDMQDIGMQQQQIRQVREQILKMSRELWNRSDPKQVYVKSDQSTPSQSTIDERALIPNEQIRLYEVLGEGSFAVVKRGVWVQSNGQKTDVAVKILRDISPNIMDDLRIEATHLLKLHHPSLIRLYGIVRQPAMMVFELCEGGSLLDRLRDDKKSIPLVSRLHDYCMQIAKALQFLESKHCVHRDVAARNILLAKDEKTVKICDFGLMRALKDNEQMYTMAPQKKVPFAWCPPEALRHRKFSHASDVWSYGVTIWEVFSLGEEPWVGCRAIDVLKNIDAGERLEKPKNCSTRIYQIMQNCWKTNPGDRCKFGAIREDLKAACFLEAVARENYNSIQPGALQLAKGDEVVVIENTSEDWYGQSKKSLSFGTFPRTTVFAQANHAVAAQTAVTPQKVPTAPTIRVPQQHIAPPPPLPFASKPLNNNSIPSVNDRTSRISMPVAGSFIHTGHGDPLSGNSWGNPTAIDDMYLKNPIKGVPLSSTSGGAQVIASKEQLTNGGRSTHIPAAPSTAKPQLRGLSLDLPEYDDFDRFAFDDGFSPSNIELPRGFGNESMISNGSSSQWNGGKSILIEAPKPVEQKFDIRGNVLQPTPLVPTHTPKPILVAPTSNGVASMQLPDRFTTPQPHSSISINSYPHSSNVPHTNSTGSRLNDMNHVSSHQPKNFIPELQSRLDLGNTMRPRPASSIGLQNSTLEYNGGQVQRPFSTVNVPTHPIVPHPTSTIPCLVPTPAPATSAPKAVNNTQNPLQQALTDELKGNLNRRSTMTTVPATTDQTRRVNGSHQVQPPVLEPIRQHVPIQVQKTLQPQQVRLPPVATTVPATSSVPAPTTTRATAQTTSVPAVIPSVTTPRPTTNTTSVPALVPSATTSQPPKKTSAPATAAAQTTTTPGVVIRKQAPTQMSEEERRSKIIMEINSALPAPSSLLFGSNSTSSLPSSTSTVVPSAAPSVPKPSAPAESNSTAIPRARPPSQVVMPPKKNSEPILSTEVLQPTRLPSATTSVAQPTVRAVPQHQPTPPTAVHWQTEENKVPTQSANTHVPLFNITNSTSLYPHLSMPNYGNGYQPYGYGMQYHNGYQPYQGQNNYYPYLSSMGQQMLTPALPPLAPSEDRSSGVAQPLGESDISELLGIQNRPAPVQINHSTPPNHSTLPAQRTSPNDLSMADRMEVLYKEAHFTHRGNCDTMVKNCNGDTETALKMLKQQHLMNIGVADSVNSARQALEASQYDLQAAANMLLG